MAIIKIEFNTIQSQRKRPYLVIHKFNQNVGISGYRSPLLVTARYSSTYIIFKYGNLLCRDGWRVFYIRTRTGIWRVWKSVRNVRFSNQIIYPAGARHWVNGFSCYKYYYCVTFEVNGFEYFFDMFLIIIAILL